MIQKSWKSRHSLDRLGHCAIRLIFAGCLLAASAQFVSAQAPAENGNPPKKDSVDNSKQKIDPTVAPKTDDQEPPTAAASSDYRIGLDDQLLISVWREPELTMSVVVRPDGMITFPLLNDLRVVGLKPLELQQLMTDKLKAFVSEPQVTVVVQGIKSRKVFLVGQVGKQGAFSLEGGETILQLLASAGGVTMFAKADSIYILRTENKKQIRIPFQYKKALQGRAKKDDIVLQPGDVVVVP